MHFYSYPNEQAILNLTPHQFNDRMNDIGEVHNMMQGGEGKGRIRRDKKKWREWFKRNKKKPPKGYRR